MDAADYAAKLLLETREEIVRADSKANLIAAAAGIGVSALIGGFVAGDLGLEDQAGLTQVMAAFSAVLLLAGTGLIGAVIWPSTGDPVAGRAHYYAEIAAVELDDLEGIVSAGAPESMARDLQQAHALARIVAKKYRLTRSALMCFGLGLLLAAATATSSLA